MNKKNKNLMITGIAILSLAIVSTISISLITSSEKKEDNTKYTVPLILSQIPDPENILYEGDISESKLNGNGELYYFGDTFGLLAEGEFKDGSLDKGVFSLTTSDPGKNKSYSIRNEGLFNESGLIGEGTSKIEIIENGNKTSIYFDGYFENGKLNGLGNMTVFTDADGKIYDASGTFKNGVIQKGGAANE